jgi:hypothetical protein
MKRRSFLKRGLFGGFLLATAGGLGLGLFPSLLERKPRRALKVLDEKRFAVLAAIAARTVQAPGADPIEIAHAVDATIALGVPEAQSDFRQALLLFENALAGLLFDGRTKPFTRLSPEAQDAVLLAWRDSKLVVRRAAYHSLRKLTLAAHYANPTSWPTVGYQGPPQISVPT